MAEEPTGVEPPASPETMAREIESLRADLDDVVAELDRRRHELTDWRLQLRRHRGKLLVVAAGVAAAVAGCIVLAVRRHHEREQPISKLRRLRAALARVIDNPDAVAPSPVGRERAVEAGTKVATSLGQRLLPSFARRLPWFDRRANGALVD